MPHVVSNTGQPVGSIQPYGGGAAPASWLVCDGSVLSQTTYASLFASIGSAFNIGGEGAGNFRMPDYRGRTPLGFGTGTGLSARSIGQSFGEETHLLSVPEMPSHGHSVFDAGHSHTGPNLSAAGNSQAGGDGRQIGSVGGISTNAANIQQSNAGGGGSHNNMQPSLVCNLMMKVY